MFSLTLCLTFSSTHPYLEFSDCSCNMRSSRSKFIFRPLFINILGSGKKKEGFTFSLYMVVFVFCLNGCKTRKWEPGLGVYEFPDILFIMRYSILASGGSQLTRRFDLTHSSLKTSQGKNILLFKDCVGKWTVFLTCWLHIRSNLRRHHFPFPLFCYLNMGNPQGTWFFRFEHQWKHLTSRTGEKTHTDNRVNPACDSQAW